MKQIYLFLFLPILVYSMKNDTNSAATDIMAKDYKAPNEEEEKVHLITPSGHSYVLTHHKDHHDHEHHHHHKKPYVTETSGYSGSGISSTGCSSYNCPTSHSGSGYYSKEKHKPVYKAPSKYFPKPHYKPYGVTSSTGTTSTGSGYHYKPQKHQYKLPTSYGAPSSSGLGYVKKHKKHHYKMPTTSYGVPSSTGTGLEYYKQKKHKQHYKVPTTSYGVPSSSGTSGIGYHKKKQKHHYKAPSTSYTAPSSVSSSYYKKPHYHTPSTSYGVPSSSGLSSTGYSSYYKKHPTSSYGAPSSTGVASYYKKKHHGDLTHAIFKPVPLYCPLCTPKTHALHSKLLNLHHKNHHQHGTDHTKHHQRSKRNIPILTRNYYPKYFDTPITYSELKNRQYNPNSNNQLYVLRHQPILKLLPNLFTKPYYVPYTLTTTTTTPEPMTTTTELYDELILQDYSDTNASNTAMDMDIPITMPDMFIQKPPTTFKPYHKYNTTSSFNIENLNSQILSDDTDNMMSTFMQPPKLDAFSEYSTYNVDELTITTTEPTTTSISNDDVISSSQYENKYHNKPKTRRFRKYDYRMPPWF